MSYIRNSLRGGYEFLRERGNAVIAACLALSASIFLIDINIPLGVAGGVPYIAVVLLAAPISKAKNSLYLALLCSALVVIAYFASPVGGEFWTVIANRTLALFAIWVTAFLSLMHKKRLDEIAGSELRKAGMLESAFDGIISVDSSDAVIEYNPAAERIFGYTSKEAMGASARDLFVPPQHRAAYEAEFQKYHARDTSGAPRGRFETMALRATQETFPIEIAAASFRVEGEHILTAHIRDRTVEIGLEMQLRQSQKMEAIGTLAGGIAHDFNNILFAIRGFTELSRDVSDGNVQLQGYLEEIGKAELRASDLVKQILTFSRQGEHAMRPLQVQTVLKEVTKLLGGTLPSTIEIRKNISESCGPVNADPAQIHQVIMNLCTNAYQAMGDVGGILTIRLDEQRIDADSVNIAPNLYYGDYVKLTISDTGCGMNEETLGRIFEPFFTTKQVTQGTGLGLATAHGIVKDHGGAIVAESALGRGTTMEVFLPRCEEKIESPTPGDDGGPPLRGHERLLIVDDEEQIIMLTKSALKRLGYKITATNYPQEALKIFSAAPESFDLVITDLIMPKIDGIKLCKELRRIRPGIPVIICTGFSESLGRFGGHEADISGLIHKPAGTQEIARAIRAALENPSEKDVNEPSPCN